MTKAARFTAADLTRAVTAILASIVLWLLSIALAKAIGSVWKAWAIGYVTAVIVTTIDRRMFGRKDR